MHVHTRTQIHTSEKNNNSLHIVEDNIMFINNLTLCITVAELTHCLSHTDPALPHIYHMVAISAPSCPLCYGASSQSMHPTNQRNNSYTTLTAYHCHKD